MEAVLWSLASGLVVLAAIIASEIRSRPARLERERLREMELALAAEERVRAEYEAIPADVRFRAEAYMLTIEESLELHRTGFLLKRIESMDRQGLLPELDEGTIRWFSRYRR